MPKPRVVSGHKLHKSSLRKGTWFRGCGSKCCSDILWFSEIYSVQLTWSGIDWNIMGENCKGLTSVWWIGSNIEKIVEWEKLWLDLEALWDVCSVTEPCPTLCDPMDCSNQVSLSFTISRSLLTHVHWVGDAIQPSHPLLSRSSAFNLSQHQGLFQCGISKVVLIASCHEMAGARHAVQLYWRFHRDFNGISH